MSVIERAQHYTTLDLGGQSRRRIVSNWVNYRLPSGLWLATQDANAVEGSMPDDWEGAYDFRYQKLEGPIQYFAGDTTDVNNTTLVGIRSSEYPQFWLNFKALGVNQGTPWTTYPNQRAIGWIDLWQNSDLFWGIKRNGVSKKIRLKQWPHPLIFRFALKIPARMTYEVVGDILILRNASNGNELMRSRKPYIEDANGDIYPAHLREGNPAGGYPTIEVYVVANEVPNPVYPLWLDPTVALSGTAAIEDAELRIGASNLLNYGGAVSLATSAITGNKGVTRIVTGQLPSGTVSALRFFRSPRFAVGAGATVGYFRLLAGNDWVEGASNGSIEVGACCGAYAKYNTQAWLGGQSDGPTVIGTDVDAASTDIVVGATSPNVYLQHDLNPAWVDSWRTTNNDGFTAWNVAGTNFSVWQSTETDLVAPPYFEIDYEEAAVSGVNTAIFLPILKRKIF